MADIGRLYTDANGTQARYQGKDGSGADVWEPVVQQPPQPTPLAQSPDQPKESVGWTGALSSGASQSINALRTAFNLWTGDDEETLDLASREFDKTPQQEDFMRAIQARSGEADDNIMDGIRNVFGAAREAPKGAWHEFLGQLPNSAVALGGMATGAGIGTAVAGPVGTVAGGIIGMFAGNAGLETGFLTQEKARDGTLTPEEMSDAKRQGLIKGGVITGVDAATIGLSRALLGAPGRAVEGAIISSLRREGVDVAKDAAVKNALSVPATLNRAMEAGGRALMETMSRGTRTTRGLTAFSAETLSEGVGEYFGSMAAGLEASPTDAVMESLMSMPQSFTELRVAKSLTSKGGITSLVEEISGESIGSEDVISVIAGTEDVDSAIQAANEILDSKKEFSLDDVPDWTTSDDYENLVEDDGIEKVGWQTDPLVAELETDFDAQQRTTTYDGGVDTDAPDLGPKISLAEPAPTNPASTNAPFDSETIPTSLENREQPYIDSPTTVDAIETIPYTEKRLDADIETASESDSRIGKPKYEGGIDFKPEPIEVPEERAELSLVEKGQERALLDTGALTEATVETKAAGVERLIKRGEEERSAIAELNKFAATAENRNAVMEKAKELNIPSRLKNTKQAWEARNDASHIKPVKTYKQEGGSKSTIHEISQDQSEIYIHHLQKARKEDTFGASLADLKAKDVKEARVFMDSDGDFGFAIQKNGDIVGVFKSPSSKKKGIAQDVMKLAVAQGGNRLDAFDTQLPGIYSKAGFKAVARMKWNEQYKPKGWSSETYKEWNNGKPDVVFMVYDPKGVDKYQEGDGIYVKDYDRGVELQNNALGIKSEVERTSKVVLAEEKEVRAEMTRLHNLAQDQFGAGNKKEGERFLDARTALKPRLVELNQEFMGIGGVSPVQKAAAKKRIAANTEVGQEVGQSAREPKTVTVIPDTVSEAPTPRNQVKEKAPTREALQVQHKGNTIELRFEVSTNPKGVVQHIVSAFDVDANGKATTPYFNNTFDKQFDTEKQYFDAIKRYRKKSKSNKAIKGKVLLVNQAKTAKSIEDLRSFAKSRFGAETAEAMEPMLQEAWDNKPEYRKIDKESYGYRDWIIKRSPKNKARWDVWRVGNYKTPAATVKNIDEAKAAIEKYDRGGKAVNDLGDGRSFTGFFSGITSGRTGKPSTSKIKPEIDTSSASEFAEEYNKNLGNFDDHIAASIPTFRELQVLVGNAIVNTFSDGTMLDIGASEGALVKTVTKQSKGNIKTLALDPNPSMAKTFADGETVSGSVYAVEAFGTAEQEGQLAWEEDAYLADRDGTKTKNPYARQEIKYFDPAGQKFDVVHEAMVFQFMSSNRDLQIGRVKELLSVGGVAIIEEKFVPGEGLTEEQFKENEDIKDVYKNQYFTEQQIKDKARAVGVAMPSEEQTVGMADLMVPPGELEGILAKHFDTVVQFWDSGNFKGYIASDDPGAIAAFIENLPSTESNFSTTQTPSLIAGEGEIENFSLIEGSDNEINASGLIDREDHHPDGSQKMTTREIGALFDDVVKRTHGEPLSEQTEENKEKISSVMADETLAALRRDDSGVEWYARSMQQAVEQFARIHPEVLSSPEAMVAFRAAIAITSNGTTVEENAKNTESVYSSWKKSGEMPVVGFGKEAESMEKGFAKYNALVKEHGAEGAEQFLDAKISVKELKKMGYSISGENLPTIVHGSAIFGPKVGVFYQNIGGNLEPLTMDRWFVRTWNRYSGTNIPDRSKAFPKRAANLRAEIAKERRIPGYKKSDLMRDDEVLMAFAIEQNRNLRLRKFKDKTEIEARSKNLEEGVLDQKLSPSGGGERNWMREVSMRALEKVRDAGTDIEPATMQALLWYAEKDLYRSHGIGTKKARTDYGTEFGSLADRLVGKSPTAGAGRESGQAQSNDRQSDQARQDQGVSEEENFEKLTPRQAGRRKFVRDAAVLGSFTGGIATTIANSEDTTTLGRAVPMESGKQRATVNAKAEGLLRDGNLVGALEEIAKNGKSGFKSFAGIAAKLLKGAKVNVVVDSESNQAAHGVTRSGAGGVTIVLHTKHKIQEGLSETTVVHEALHAVVMSRYSTLSVGSIMSNYEKLGLTKPQAELALRQFVKVWREFKSAVDADGASVDSLPLEIRESYNDVDEFFVRSLTDDVLQQYSSKKVYEGRTLLQRFSDWVKYSLFGLSRSGEVPSWLDAALVASTDLLEAMSDDSPDLQMLSKLRDRRGLPAMFEKIADQDPFQQENKRLRGTDKSAWDKAGTFMKRQFSPGGLLPDPVFNLKIDRDNQFEVIEFDAAHLIGSLDAAIKKDYGKTLDQLSNKDKRALSEGLAGKMTIELRENSKAVLLAMRRTIDKQSGEISGILLSEATELMDRALADPTNKKLMTQAEEKLRVAEIIQANLGIYVHRSYQAFDDAKWFKGGVSSSVVNETREFLTAGLMASGDELYVTKEDAEKRADVLMSDLKNNSAASGDFLGYIRESKLGEKDLRILMDRKQFAPIIRQFLGEYQDPRLNFAKSTTKMGRLTYNHRFLEKVKEVGMGQFIFTEKNRPPDTVELAGESKDAYSPLNGYWVPIEVNQAFVDALGKENMDTWYKTIVQANGLVKFGKTILSPTTAARNWQSALFFTIANGHFNLGHVGKSVSGFKEYFTRLGDGDKLKYLRKLKELGVVYDTPYAGEMMRLLDDAKLDNWMANSGMGGKFKSALQIAQKFYQYGDDFWKIIGFENEKASLIKAGLSETDAEVEAAERIRNTYPTYSMVGRGIRKLRKFPLAGTFVSFPAEIIRTTFNMLNYAAKDMKDPVMRPLAIRRIAGMSIAAGFAVALQELSKQMFDIDDDDEEAVRLQAAPWNKNSNLVFTGRNEDGMLRYIDVSYVDPYNYWKRPINAILRDQPWEDAAVDIVKETLSPFLGTDIAAGSIFQILSNKKESGGEIYNPSDMPQNQLVDITNHLRKSVQPGVISNLERTWLAMRGEKSRSGKKYDLYDEGLAWVGWRVSTLDPVVALKYRSYDFKDKIEDANRVVSFVMKSPNAVDEGDLRSAYNLSEKIRYTAYEQMFDLLNASRRSGMTRLEIINTMRDANMSRTDITSMLNETHPVWRPSRQSEIRAYRSARALGPDQPALVRQRYRMVRRFSLEE